MSGTGVETFHADTLLGLSGSVIDRMWQYLTGANYQGDNIRLTVDAELTAYLAKIFPEGKAGAAVVLNYQTGEILAMVSRPDYDPEDIANRMEGADETGSGFLNRCLQGQYAPGSVFKLVTLASALEHIPDITTRSFYCEGSRAYGPVNVTCYGGEVHGQITLAQALAKSCNVTFAEIALALGKDNLIKTARKLGFDDNFQFRDVVLYESTIPGDIWGEGELAWTGVGQGRLLVTPLHMAMIAGAVANGGVMTAPRLIREVTGVGGIRRLRVLDAPYRNVMGRNIASIVGNYMKKSVESGTSRRAALNGLDVRGKTGTAEVSDDKSVPTNAWFVGYLAEEAAPYAVAVVVEGGGTGGDTAAPIGGKAPKKAAELGLYAVKDAPAP